MEVEFGYVQQYDTARGFGFISRTFNKANQRHRKNVWFHITKLKRDYPHLAKELDAGSLVNISFWYEVNNTDGEKVSKIWIDSKAIPKQQRDDLLVYVEQVWCNTSNSLPEWLDQITLSLVGQLRKDELYQKRNVQIHAQKELEETKLLQRRVQGEQRKSQIEQKREQRQHIDIEHVYSGLPEHLVSVVLWVNRKSRTHPWSHIPGGSDVVVEYHDGKAFGYDWIKKPSAYISTFFTGIMNIEIAKRRIAKIFARKYKDESEYSATFFKEIWNSETSNEMPLKSLERFERKQQSQQNLEGGYNFILQSAFEYYGYKPEHENFTDEAERLWDIPDPRLVED